MIGFKGTILRHIKEKCHVGITISAIKNPQAVTIKGSHANIRNAKYMIETLTGDHHEQWISLPHDLHVHFDADVLYDYVFRSDEVDFLDASIRLEDLYELLPNMSIFFRTMENTTSFLFNPAIVLKQLAEIKGIPIDQRFDGYKHIVSNHKDMFKYYLHATIYYKFQVESGVDVLKHKMHYLAHVLPESPTKVDIPELPSVETIPVLGYNNEVLSLLARVLDPEHALYEPKATWTETYTDLVKEDSLAARFQVKYLWCLMHGRRMV